MEFYEVMVPGPRGKGFDDVLQIEAADWRAALASALGQLGQKPDLTNAYVEVVPAGYRVTDSVGRRVIKIRRLDPSQRAVSAVLRPATEAAANPSPPMSDSGARPSVGFTNRATGAFRSIGAAEIAAVKAQQTNPEARILQQTVVPAAPADADPTDRLPPEVAEKVRQSLDSKSHAVALEDVFLEIPAIFEPGYAMEDAIDFVIDLLTRHVPCEAALMCFASDQADHLYVAAARGAGRKKLEEATLSIHEGIPAESLRNGVAIALVDPSRDKRHKAELKKYGITETSMCCAPVQHEARAFGVLVLVNRSGASHFSSDDSNVVSYIGLQMGKFIQHQLDATPLE